jgi:hypothetical protein
MISLIFILSFYASWSKTEYAIKLWTSVDASLYVFKCSAMEVSKNKLSTTAIRLIYYKQDEICPGQ